MSIGPASSVTGDAVSFLNLLGTMTCNDCGHCRDRHVFHPAICGCLVQGCECKAKGEFSIAKGPLITETVGNGKTHILQPLAPKVGTV